MSPHRAKANRSGPQTKPGGDDNDHSAPRRQRKSRRVTHDRNATLTPDALHDARTRSSGAPADDDER